MNQYIVYWDALAEKKYKKSFKNLKVIKSLKDSCKH